MASEPKDYTIFIWMILTSNTEATENKEIAQMHGERADSFYRKIGQKLHLTVVHSVTLSILS